MLGNYRKLFANRDYANLWVGQTASVVGDSVYQVAFYWLVYQMSPSPLIAGFAIFAGTAPYLLFGLLGGVYADRLDRKKVMVLSDVIRAAVVTVVPLLSLGSMLSVTAVALAAFVLMSVRCFFYPAAKSAVADILKDDAERRLGSSFLQASFQAARVLGMAAGGLLVTRFSAPIVYLIPFVTFLISIKFLLPIKTMSRNENRGEPVSVIADILDTVRFIRPIHELFWPIVLFGAVLLLITGVDRIALPALSDKIWQVGSDGLGIMLGAFAVGNVIASLVIGNFTIKRFGPLIFIGWALWGACYALIGAQSFFALALGFAFLAGAAEALSDVPFVIMIQTLVPSERMGKVFSMWSTVAFIGETGSALVAGLLVGALGPSEAYFVAGAGVIAVAAAGLLLTQAPLLMPGHARRQETP